MSADFVASTVLRGSGQREWVKAARAAMHEKGATWFWLSHPIDRPDEIYLEGWRELPAEIGPRPWEIEIPDEIVSSGFRPT